MHPTAVRCPNCDKRVLVTPRVRAVTHEAGALTVTFQTVAAPHHCGVPPQPTGFAPPSRGGKP